VTGRIKLNAWATNQNKRIDTVAGISILKNCVLCLLNGALGQRGLLMQRIQIYNIAVRCTGMTVDFSVWLPSVRSSSDEADTLCVAMRCVPCRTQPYQCLPPRSDVMWCVPPCHVCAVLLLR
jgi:hypothetical protein